jgi:hypothetical protein
MGGDVYMVGIEAELILHVEHDQDAAGDAHRQADDVDQRIAFVAPQVAASNFQIVLDHSFSF